MTEAVRDFAAFIDRDGTINVDVDFLSKPEQLQLIPRSAEAIRLLNELNIPVIVITNQSGIARGIFREDDLHGIHRELDKQLQFAGAKIDGYYYCPHHPNDGVAPYVTDCECRKPKPGMLKQAQKKFTIDLTKSFLVGDKAIDIRTGKSVGAISIQVSTGYGTAESQLCSRERDYYAADLYEAVEYIAKTVHEREH